MIIPDPSVADAIRSLVPKAEFYTTDDVPTYINLNGETQPTDAEITAEKTRLKGIFDNNKYQRDREPQYPSMQEQLDMQYWDQVNGTSKWKDAIAKVKSDNPKPS
jgi:hypothetical protein